MAEGQGFEPWKAVTPCWFSRPVHSTALPSLRRENFDEVRVPVQGNVRSISWIGPIWLIAQDGQTRVALVGLGRILWTQWDG